MKSSKKPTKRGWLSPTHVSNKPLRTKLPQACTICNGNCTNTYEKVLDGFNMTICSIHMDVLKYSKIQKVENTTKIINSKEIIKLKDIGSGKEQKENKK